MNRRRRSRETPLGPGGKKDGCFRRLSCNRCYMLQPLMTALSAPFARVIARMDTQKYGETLRVHKQIQAEKRHPI